MRIVVDTNIIFSALLNESNTFRRIILSLDSGFEFYGCNCLLSELSKYSEKIKKHSKLQEDKLNSLFKQILKKLVFTNEKMVPSKIWMEAKEITKEIDVDDFAFVALTMYLNAKLWTGDKYLYNGLKRINFNDVINTAELLTLSENNSAN